MILEGGASLVSANLQMQGRCPVPYNCNPLLLSRGSIVGIFIEPHRLPPISGLMPTPPKKLRKQYANKDYPNVVLRFEDGHEIEIIKGAGKTFDCYAAVSYTHLRAHETDS